MFSRSVLKILSRMLIVAFLFNTGCATIMTGNTQIITINSSPRDATAKVGGFEVRTPGIINLKKGSDYTVTVEKEGYEPGQVKLERSFNKTYLLNILFGPILLGIPLVFGLIYDWGNGSIWNIAPDSVNVTLKEKGAAPQPSEKPAAPQPK